MRYRRDSMSGYSLYLQGRPKAGASGAHIPPPPTLAGGFIFFEVVRI